MLFFGRISRNYQWVSDKKQKAPKKKAEAEPEVEEVAAEPVEVVKPVEVAKPVKKEKSPEPAPVVPEPAAKAAAAPAPAKKSNKNDLVIPAGKISDEEAENIISALVKKLGGRVPKGSKVTLASNVDNLKVRYFAAPFLDFFV